MSPLVENFLDSLDRKSSEKILAVLNRLQSEGPNLIRPFADIVRGKIRELRVQRQSNQYRILYFFYHRNEIILLHGFKKKTQKLKFACS